MKGEPFAKQRPRFTKSGGVYTPAKTVAYEEAVAWAARACGKTLGDVPLGMVANFYFSARRRGDGDNFQKAIWDGAQKSGLFDNDFQIEEWRCKIMHDPDNPRVEVLFYTLADWTT